MDEIEINIKKTMTNCSVGTISVQTDTKVKTFKDGELGPSVTRILVEVVVTDEKKLWQPHDDLNDSILDDVKKVIEAEYEEYILN